MNKVTITGITFLIVVGCLVFGIVNIKKKACNKKGTLAHQINWADNNCEEVEEQDVLKNKGKETLEEEVEEEVGVKEVSKEAKKALKEWIEKDSEKEDKDADTEEEDDTYKIQVEIDECWETFYNKEHDWFSYYGGFYKCKKKELIFENCLYIEEKELCIEKAEKEAETLASESKNEYFKNTPEEAAAAEKQKTKEELKNTIKEALQELGD